MRNIDDFLDAAFDIQSRHPQLILCGSVALMGAKLLDERPIGDLDFVCLDNQIPSRSWLSNPLELTEDVGGAYAEEPDEQCYRSFHGRHYWFKWKYDINLLVHPNDFKINVETITHRGKEIRVQNLAEIVSWKEEYDRAKDRKDLENIMTNTIEKELAR